MVIPFHREGYNLKLFFSLLFFREKSTIYVEKENKRNRWRLFWSSFLCAIFFPPFLYFQFFPRWLAPNLITFVGFLCTVASFILLCYYDYYYYASSSNYPEYVTIPKYVFTLIGILIFVAYTLGRYLSKNFM